MEEWEETSFEFRETHNPCSRSKVPAQELDSTGNGHSKDWVLQQVDENKHENQMHYGGDHRRVHRNIKVSLSIAESLVAAVALVE